jgi:hypothetical protein
MLGSGWFKFTVARLGSNIGQNRPYHNQSTNPRQRLILQGVAADFSVNELLTKASRKLNESGRSIYIPDRL